MTNVMLAKTKPTMVANPKRETIDVGLSTYCHHGHKHCSTSLHEMQHATYHTETHTLLEDFAVVSADKVRRLDVELA